jgi:hypothetical protein
MMMGEETKDLDLPIIEPGSSRQKDVPWLGVP